MFFTPPPLVIHPHPPRPTRSSALAFAIFVVARPPRAAPDRRSFGRKAEAGVRVFSSSAVRPSVRPFVVVSSDELRGAERRRSVPLSVDLDVTSPLLLPARAARRLLPRLPDHRRLHILGHRGARGGRPRRAAPQFPQQIPPPPPLHTR